MIWSEERLRELARYMISVATEDRPKAKVLTLVPKGRAKPPAVRVMLPDKANGTIN